MLTVKTTPVVQTLSLSKLAAISVVAHVGVVAGYAAFSSLSQQPKPMTIDIVDEIPMQMRFVTSQPRHVDANMANAPMLSHPDTVVLKEDMVTTPKTNKTPKLPPKIKAVTPQDQAVAKSSAPLFSSQPTPLDTIATRQAYMPEPVYPKSALRRHQSGLVVVMFQLNTLGQVVAVSVETSSGVEALDQAAVEAVKTWRFPKVVAKSHGTITAPIRFVI